ncbi:hypothetical protein IQ273_33305, partial [Nodosilinea sp. LEGE 07298]
QLQSILAARPSTPARLSRSTALGYAFDPLRLHYPPMASVAALDTDAAEPPPSLLSHPERSRARSTRTNHGLQVLYTFQPGDRPNQVQDVSGVGEPINLTIGQPNRVTWLEGGGLRLNESTIVDSNQPPNRLIEALRATNEITVEVWVKPAGNPNRPDQLLPQPAPGKTGPARIVTLSNDIGNRFFTLGQEAPTQTYPHALRLRLRTTLTDNNGVSYLPPHSGRDGPTLVTAADFTLQPRLMPVVFTRRADGTTRLYSRDSQGHLRFVELLPPGSDPGSFSNWVAASNQRFDLVLGNERGGTSNSDNSRPWLGEFYLVAIYNQALAQAEVESLVQQGIGAGGSAQQPPYSWHQTALQLKTSGLFPPEDLAETGLIRHAAATLLPARLRVAGQPNP